VSGGAVSGNLYLHDQHVDHSDIFDVVIFAEFLAQLVLQGFDRFGNIVLFDWKKTS
jgi:hypothetical protein